MDDVPCACPECNVRYPPPVGEEQQVASLVAFAVRRHLDLAALPVLLIAVAWQANLTRCVDRLHEPRAIDSPFRSSSPQIRRAAEPFFRQLRYGEVACFDA